MLATLFLVLGVMAAHVDVEDVSCGATTMGMFSCLQEPSNGIVRDKGWLVQCPYDEVDNYPVTDELRNVRTWFSYNMLLLRNYIYIVVDKKYTLCLRGHYLFKIQFCFTLYRGSPQCQSTNPPPPYHHQHGSLAKCV